MYLGQQQDHAGSPARNSAPTDQPQRKPVGWWCLTGSVEQSGVIGWQIEVVAMMPCWRLESAEIHQVLWSMAKWPCMQLYFTMLSLYATHSGKSNQCSLVCRSRNKPHSNLFVPLTTRAAAFSIRCNLSIVKPNSERPTRLNSTQLAVELSWVGS